ncbi:MAG TPA: Spy/CpxP family protein refolding chaperone [Pyrinomonadaceae bacterium]|jgi:protein CpxP|nr:Spy/CpxP family protein refolding chaperone [Pyrinomonadaceae bacterium]
MNKLGMIKTLTIASLSVLVLAASIALAQTPSGQSINNDKSQGWHGEGRGHRDGRSGHMQGMMFRDLNLTDDQKAKMKLAGDSFRERTQSLRQELKAKRQELRQASENGTFNEALATQKLQESASLQVKLMGERFKVHQDMLSILTPEQKTQMEQKRAEFKAKWAERGHHKGERNQQEEQ